MLTPGRVAVCCAASATFLLCVAAGAPGARAASGAQASFGPAAGTQLNDELASAWRTTRGRGVTVAVLSSGVNPDGPGLAGKVVTGHDYVGLPFGSPVGGTLIACAIAAAGPAGTTPGGAIGRAPQARILSIRVYPDPGVPGASAWNKSASWGDILASAIREAVNSGAKVVYVDETGDDNPAGLERAVQYALSKNVVIVSEEYVPPSDRAPKYPTSLPGVIGAGSVFLPGLVSVTPESPSPVNESILVSAPGNALAVPGMVGRYDGVQNFESAAAWVVGTAALIKSLFPDMPPALVARAMALSASDHPPGGYNPTVGFGLINPVGALREAAQLARLADTAAPGPGVVGPARRLVRGPAPGVIEAVHHSTDKLAAFGGAIAAGLICLLLAALLAWRGRRRTA